SLEYIDVTIFVRLFQLIEGEVGNADGADLTFILQLLKGCDRLILRCIFIRIMEIHQIDIVGPETFQAFFDRSEERRVGKECRCRWAEYAEGTTVRTK